MGREATWVAPPLLLVVRHGQAAAPRGSQQAQTRAQPHPPCCRAKTGAVTRTVRTGARPGLVPSHWNIADSSPAVVPPYFWVGSAGSSQGFSGVRDEAWPDTIDAVGAGRGARQRRGASFVATGVALASLALLSVAALPNAANAALLYYKLGAKLGIGGGSSISCPSPGQCTAVAGTQEVTFNPAAPKNVHRATIDSGGASLAAVACPSTTQCTGVDSNGRELTFNPAAPASPTSAIVDPIGQTGNTINGLACPSTTQCTAVDSRNVATFDPLAPAAASVSAIDPTSISEMNAVACPSTSQCTIVSGDGTQYTINPVTKTGSMSVIDLNRSLWAIACPSVSQCTAVDSDSAVTFNPGAPGTPARFGIDPDTGNSDQSLTAVACPSTSQCTAVDNQGLAVQGNPGEPARLGGVRRLGRERRPEPGRRVMRVGQCVRGARRRCRRLGGRP